MADFKKAIAVILDEEKDGHGRANKGDKGGATRWGVTQHTLDRARELHPELGLPASVAELERDLAEVVYRVLWWDPQPYAHVLDERVAAKILSADVNMGPKAIRLLQEALNEVLGDHLPGTTLFGPATLADVNRAPPVALLKAMGRHMAQHYREIIEADPTQARFRGGWMARAAWPYPGIAALVA